MTLVFGLLNLFFGGLNLNYYLKHQTNSNLFWGLVCSSIGFLDLFMYFYGKN